MSLRPLAHALVALAAAVLPTLALDPAPPGIATASDVCLTYRYTSPFHGPLLNGAQVTAPSVVHYRYLPATPTPDPTVLPLLPAILWLPDREPLHVDWLSIIPLTDLQDSCFYT